MKVLVVGSGGREHALVWKISKSPKVQEIHCAPGNAGIAEIAKCWDVRANDIPGILHLAQEKHIDLAVIGPESPLIAGIADKLRAAGIPTFGPSGAAAAIEGSKVFSKELMAKYGIPTAEFSVFDEPGAAESYIEQLCKKTNECRVVVKADGEALGKGVFVCSNKDEALQAINTIMVDRVFGKAGDRIVIEERLEGQEASIMVITDGETALPLPAVQDYKRAHDGDCGPNTGGMGCYSPVPAVTPAIFDKAMTQIVKPTIQAMRKEGRPYTGVLYAGIILTEDGLKALEFNARFGDPEAQVALPLLTDDLVDIIEATLSGSLDSTTARCYNGCAVCVVVASGGYPGNYETGKPIEGLEKASSIPGVTIFHAGTKLEGDTVVTSGGRVLGITASSETYAGAIDRAYSAVSAVRFEGMYYRHDIGNRVRNMPVCINDA